MRTWVCKTERGISCCQTVRCHLRQFICSAVLSLHDAGQVGWGHGGHPQDKCWALSLFLVCFERFVRAAVYNGAQDMPIIDRMGSNMRENLSLFVCFYYGMRCGLFEKDDAESLLTFSLSSPSSPTTSQAPDPWPRMYTVERFAPKSSVRATPWAAFSISPDMMRAYLSKSYTFQNVTRTNFVIILTTPGAGDARPPRYHPIVFILRITMLHDNFNKSRREIRGPRFSRPLHVAALGEN